MTGSEDYKVADLRQVIENDAILTARTLEIVNSAAYGMRGRCSSITLAIRLLGSNGVRDLAVAIAGMEMYDTADLRARTLRDHNAVVGSIARFMARKRGVPNISDLYTCAVLHDIGQLLLLQLYGEEYGQLVDLGVEENLCQRERDRYEYDHALLAAHMVSKWRIPDPVPTVIALHHDLRRARSLGSEIHHLVAQIRLADELAESFLYHQDDDDEDLIRVVVGGDAAKVLALGEEELTGLWYDIQAVTIQTKYLWAQFDSQ
jgi:HD-like signal output (HDOD) protein